MNPSRILIVEDESIVALDMASRLRRLGYDVVGIAASGDEAIRLANSSIDLAVMDIRLRGGVDGIETAQYLRENFGIPVVYLTAYADEATLQRAKYTEPLGYLVKPFEERELHSTLEMACYKIKMDKKIQAQAAQLERVIATVPEGVALLDKDLRLVLMNPRASLYLAELAGLSVGDVVAFPQDLSIQHLVATSGQELWHEVELSGPPRRIFEVRVSPVEGTGEETEFELVLVVRDVTIDREIQERTQVQDRLAAIGQFAAGVAHDFNNILASIILEPYMIRKLEPALSTKSLERLDSISRQAKSAGELIKQILDFSRASAIEMQVLNLVSLLEESTKMLRHLLPENISLEFVWHEGKEYTIYGDPTRIMQVLMNLALNARDAISSGGVIRIEVEASVDFHRCSDKGEDISEWVRVTVHDNGVGIEPDILPHIFEPFFSTKPTGRGTGLGLAQVYGIVQQHGGCVDASSQPGQGSTFSIYLPAIRSSSTIEYSQMDNTTPLGSGEQQTVLFVEDNAPVRQSISEILRLSNYRILTASNGREALEIVTGFNEDIDLIITDLLMPELGGVELLHELRKRNIGIKVLVMTGYISPETRDELESLGVCEYLSKPVEIDELLLAVQQNLQ